MPTATARAMEKNCFMVGSVTVRNVPDAPGGVKVFIREGAAQFTLSLLLLHHLKGNAPQFRGGSEDAVGIELNFVHVLIIDTGESRSPPPVDRSTVVTQFFEHLIHLIGVDASIHPTHTVRGHLPEVHLKGGDEVVVSAVTIDASETVHALIVVDPEGDIPGLIVCPTVEGLTLGDHGFECLHCFV